MAIVAGICSYGAYTMMFGKKQTEEITYQQFVQMMQQKRVEMITFTEEKGNSNFKYRAIIETADESFHMTLPAVENF